MHNVKNFLSYALILSLLAGATLLGGCVTTPKIGRAHV